MNSFGLEEVPAVHMYANATFINDGATITNGYVRTLGDLSVSLAPGSGKVTLASLTAERGVTYYYKTAPADDSSAKPSSYNIAFDTTGWTPFSEATDITASAEIYVQVVKVGDVSGNVYGWGQASAVPAAAASTAPSSAPESLPQTSDRNSPLIVAGMIFALMACCALYRLKRKHN